MTRRDYEKAALLVRTRHMGSELDRIAARETFVEFFRDDNPRFDVDRFRAACDRPAKFGEVRSYPGMSGLPATVK